MSGQRIKVAVCDKCRCTPCFRMTATSVLKYCGCGVSSVSSPVEASGIADGEIRSIIIHE